MLEAHNPEIGQKEGPGLRAASAPLLTLFTEVRGIGILRSSPKRSSPKFAKEVVINSSFAGCATSSSASMVQLLLKPGRRESSLTPHPAPLTKGGSFYETHHIASGRHGPNPVGGKRGGLGGQQDRH